MQFGQVTPLRPVSIHQFDIHPLTLQFAGQLTSRTLAFGAGLKKNVAEHYPNASRKNPLPLGSGCEPGDVFDRLLDLLAVAGGLKQLFGVVSTHYDGHPVNYRRLQRGIVMHADAFVV